MWTLISVPTQLSGRVTWPSSTRPWISLERSSRQTAPIPWSSACDTMSSRQVSDQAFHFVLFFHILRWLPLLFNSFWSWFFIFNTWMTCWYLKPSLPVGVRMISLSYSRISLADIAQKLQLDSPEDAEFIVAKVTWYTTAILNWWTAIRAQIGVNMV